MIVFRPDPELVKQLLDAGADPNADHVLSRASTSPVLSPEKLQIAKLLLAAGADPNADDWPLLSEAARGGQIELMEMLLAAGADINAFAERDNALHGAIKSHQFAAVEVLLDQGSIDVDARTRDPYEVTALYLAVTHRNADVADLLLKHGADPQHVTGGGLTPYQAAEKWADNDTRALFGLDPVDRPDCREKKARS